MDVKFGKLRPNNNIFLVPSAPSSEGNFFASDSSPKRENPEQAPKHEPRVSSSRINDYDANILENNAYQELSDEMFKLEHKIGGLEEYLSKINSEIEALESLGYEIQIYDLKNRKQKVEEELAALNKKYSDLGLSARISGQIASVVNFSSNKKLNFFTKLKIAFSKKVLAKLSKKFSYSQTMKEALDKLSNINLSVDELIKMKVPYGETINRYERLTAYLNKANVIHSQITRNMDEIAKKKAQ